MRLKNYFIIFVLLIGISCRKNISAQINFNNPPTSFTDVFNQFLYKMNANYVYWDIDTTNWNKIYELYYPVFQNLNLQNDGDVKKSVQYFRQMVHGLIDNHYEINFLYPAIKDSFIYPALERKIQLPNFHTPFLYPNIDTAYFDAGYNFGTYITSVQQQIIALCGTIKHKLLYFGCSQFALQEAYQSNTDNSVKESLQYFFNQLVNPSPTIKAIVIDVRNNTGGNVADLNFLLGHLINTPLSFGFTRYKNGVNPFDYTSWINASIQPVEKNGIFSLPIIVLADNYSISLAEATTMAIKAMPNSTFIGETTWGATGPITSNQLYNDGQFEVTNFCSVFTSSGEFRYINNKSYENIGFHPDINIPFNINDLRNGKDSALQKVIFLIN